MDDDNYNIPNAVYYKASTYPGSDSNLWKTGDQAVVYNGETQRHKQNIQCTVDIEVQVVDIQKMVRVVFCQ